MAGHGATTTPGLDRILGLLRPLVAFETVSRTPNRSLQEWLADRLESLGARVSIIDGPDSGRANLIGSFGPSRGGGLLLSGHTDVVPPGEGWSSDPWTMARHDDRVVGRGTADMKGFFAATLAALEAVDIERLGAPLHVLASYDEEIGCMGVREVLPSLGADPSLLPDLVVVGEPTMLRPRHAHLGKQVYRLVVTAAEAHSSRAAEVPSAIATMAELVQALSAVQTACPPAVSGASVPYSVNCGTIGGGTACNVIAANCEVEFEVRHDTDHSPDEVLAPFLAIVAACDRRLADAVGGGVRCEPVTSYPAAASDPTGAAFSRAVRLADAGPSTSLGYGTEGGLLASALGAPVMICGPGDIADAHRPDESVAVEQLERGAALVRSLVESFCGKGASPDHA